MEAVHAFHGGCVESASETWFCEIRGQNQSRFVYLASRQVEVSVREDGIRDDIQFSCIETGSRVQLNE